MPSGVEHQAMLQASWGVIRKCVWCLCLDVTLAPRGVFTMGRGLSFINRGGGFHHSYLPWGGGAFTMSFILLPCEGGAFMGAYSAASCFMGLFSFNFFFWALSCDQGEMHYGCRVKRNTYSWIHLGKDSKGTNGTFGTFSFSKSNCAATIYLHECNVPLPKHFLLYNYEF